MHWQKKKKNALAYLDRSTQLLGKAISKSLKGLKMVPDVEIYYNLYLDVLKGEMTFY